MRGGERGEEVEAPAIRVVLPAHLKALAGVSGELSVAVTGEVTILAVLEALERAHPSLKGTLRPHGAQVRRPLLRFYADGEDLSLFPLDTQLPPSVAEGREPLLVVGAIAGG